MRFQSIVLAAVAALGSTVVAQSSVISSAESAASSAVSSATSSVASSVRSSGSSSSSDASSTSSASSAAASSSSASSSVTSSSDSSSVTSSASASASSSSSDDDEEPTSTRVYTTTYYYVSDNSFHKAVSPTLLIESVVKSTSGAVDQQTFSTPTGGHASMVTIHKSTFTTTMTSTNRFHDPVSKYFTNVEVVTTTMGLPFTDTSSSDGAAGRVSAREIGGVAAFFLGIAGMYL